MCWGGCVERWWEMEICMRTSLLSLLLNLVLSVGNVMLPIEDLMVDSGCIATTGGRRLFCFTWISLYIYTNTWLMHIEYSFIMKGSRWTKPEEIKLLSHRMTMSDAWWTLDGPWWFDVFSRFEGNLHLFTRKDWCLAIWSLYIVNLLYLYIHMVDQIGCNIIKWQIP
jgi:hypothetical protein